MQTPTKEQHATVTGDVIYRLGDGPTQCVPRGPVAVTQSDNDVTLSWTADGAALSTSIPQSDFKRYVAESAISLDGGRA